MDLKKGLSGHWPLAGDTRDQSGTGNHARNHGADLKAANTFEAPKRVVPQALEAPKAGPRMTFELPARSYATVTVAV